MLESEYAGFTVETRDDGIVLVTLNRPERMNGMRRSIKRDLQELTTQLAYSKDYGVVVITGTENFCAGDDVSAGDPNEWEQARSQSITQERHDSIATYSSLRAISQSAIRAWRELDLLTVAAIDGYAIQWGLTLALACDFRIATSRARLGSATLRMGFLPDEGGHYLLVQHLGVARTKDFLFRQKIVTAEQALQMGLLNEVVEPEELMPRALAFGAELAAGPRVAQRLLKHSIDSAAELTFEQACRDIAVRTAITDHHPDAVEGRTAFIAKPRRRPNFNQT